MKTFLTYHKASLGGGEVCSYVKIQSPLWPHQPTRGDQLPCSYVKFQSPLWPQPPTRGDQLPLKKTPKKERNQNKNTFCSSRDPGVEEVYQGVLSS